MPDWMQRYAYIVTGTQILANIEQVDQTEKPNELVRAVNWTGRNLRSVWNSANNTIERWSTSDSSILFDPALVISNFTLVGWN